MSPEQLGGQEAGPTSDVFASRGVLAFAATARPPFGGDAAAAVIHHILSQSPDLAGLADEQLRQLITDCLAKSPGDRPALPAILATLRPSLPRLDTGLVEASQTRTMTGHQASVRGVAFSPDGRLLASASRDGTVRLWDPRKRRAPAAHQRTLSCYGYTIHAVAFSPDVRLLAGGTGC